MPANVLDRRAAPLRGACHAAHSEEFCEFYTPEVEEALKRVPGVVGVDLRTVKGAAVVAYEAGKLNPRALLAVSSVKGPGYSCKAKVLPG